MEILDFKKTREKKNQRRIELRKKNELQQKRKVQRLEDLKRLMELEKQKSSNKLNVNIGKVNPNDRLKDVNRPQYNFKHGYSEGTSKPITDQKPVEVPNIEPPKDYSIKVIDIFSNGFIKNMTHVFSKKLLELGIQTNLHFREINNDDINRCEKDNNRYLLLFNSQFLYDTNFKYKAGLKALPKNKYIIYQIEQLNQKTYGYQSVSYMHAILNNAYAIFDYSKTNVSYYPSDIQKRISIIKPIIGLVSQETTKTIDILFMGMVNDRRRPILDKLKEYNNKLDKGERLNIEIVENKYGDELIEIIKKSRILFNIHAFPNAILEIFRIHDVIAHDIRIISEKPEDGDIENLVERYKSYIEFIDPINGTNVDSRLEGLFQQFSKRTELDRENTNKMEFIERLNNENTENIKNTLFNIINILIRNTYRPKAFSKCIQSILGQSYKHYRIIACYDDENCEDYLNEYNNHANFEIFKATRIDKTKKCFYNLYCNELLNKVKHGWVMFLDDDDMLATSTALETISLYLLNNNNNSNNLLLWKFNRPDKLIYPNINEMKRDTIVSCGYCFHSNHKDLSKWTAHQGGDYDYIQGLMKRNNFNKLFINEVLTKTTFDGKKGGNYGQKEPYQKKKIKYSIIMAYYNRKEQTILSFNQFERLYGNKYDFEVVIVDDCSDENEKLSDIVNNYSFKIKYIELKNKTWINPVVPLNIAISNISHDVDTVIFQNPETFHCNDILHHSRINIDSYFVYPVFNSPSYEENNKLKQLFVNNCTNYYKEFINKIDYTKYRGEWDDRVIDVWKGWLQHKDLNNRKLHFLTAISKSTLDKIGGFCNEMKDGLWYDDDDFLTRIKKVARTISIESKELVGIHQKHNGGSNTHEYKYLSNLKQKNSNIYQNNIKNNIIYCDPHLSVNYNCYINTKISIVMAYYNRKPQTLETLKGFERMYTGKYNFEVVIVDDNSNHENRLEEDIKQFTFPINLIVISAEEKGDRVNPCIAYNKGFSQAKGDIIMIQNPECYHVGDILKHTIENLDEQDYFSYSCFSPNSFELTQELLATYNTFEYILQNDHPKSDLFKRNKNEFNYSLMWYNYPKIEKDPNHDVEILGHPLSTYYHYCSAIYKSKLDLNGGFDKRFADGYCFDDDQFVLSIRYTLKMNMSIIHPKNSFVIHQYHVRNAAYGIENSKEETTISKRWIKNKRLYECLKLNYELENEKSFSVNEITKILLDNKIYKIHFLIENKFTNILNELNKYLIENSFGNLVKSNNILHGIYNPQNISYYNNIPKIFFTYWDMSTLSFIHFLTLYTIKKHHPDFEIILYYPKKRVCVNTWKSFENKVEINCKSYINYLKLLDIKIIEVDFEKNIPDIPFYLSEVIKSDIFRLYICKEVGGIWFDMDTFWINSITNNFYCNSKDYYPDLHLLDNHYNQKKSVISNFNKKDNIYDYSYFVMCSRCQDNLKQNHPHFCQYILAHNKNSKIVNLLFNSCLEYLNCDEYESIGTPMFSKILSNYMLKDKEFNYNKSTFNINIFAPFKWFQMKQLFEETIEINLDKSACIHWFNGSPFSKKFINNVSHYNIGSINECSFKNIYNKYITRDDKLFLKYLDTKINNKKISIVMAYFNRKDQLEMTLETIKKSKYQNKEIIIVDDNSRPDQSIELFIDKYRNYLDIKVITIKENEKNWINLCIPYNIGIKAASGDIIVLQNPEVMHIGDCLTFINDNLEKKDWLSFNCYGSANFQFNEKVKNKTSNEIFNNIYNINFNIGGNSIVRDEVGGWLNHYDKHFVAYHYLAAIHRNDLFEIMNGGFDKNFKDGIGSDDDELIKRLIYNKLNFKISKFESEKPFCIHLYHEKSESVKNLHWKDNKKIFIESCINMNMIPENDIAFAPKNEIPMSRRVIID